MSFRLLLAGAACTLLAWPTGAQAQVDPTRPQVGVSKQPTREAPPPALPGSRATQAPAAETGRAATDLPPNEALFDAINRGDEATARDALNRGADLNGHNVLGQTPLDLSIDLGRNQITFLLLSMRAGDTSAPAPPVVAKLTREQVLAERHAARLARPARQVRVAQPRPAPTAPRLFAADGGAPAPQSGFLGFGER